MDLQAQSDPEDDHYGASEGDVASPIVADTRDSQQSKKNAARKRTKTGCLTCRQRRIKCDEGKPVCNNCIKSKRNCQGYNQRLTFKEPQLGAYQNHPSFFGHSHPVFPPQGPGTLIAAQVAVPNPPRSSLAQGNPLPVIAPRPPEFYQFDGVFHSAPGRQDLYLPPNHPGSTTGASSLSLSPTQFNQHQFSPQQFSPNNGAFFHHPNIPTPTSAHADPGRDDFFKVVSPSLTAAGEGLFSQYTPSDHRVPQPLSQNSRRRPKTDNNVPVPGGSSHETRRGYWSSDDEASMGESEDDLEADIGKIAEARIEDDLALESNNLGAQVARQMNRAGRPGEYYDARVRTFTGFVDANNVLDTYSPSSTNSPLNDTQTASVFWYFVNVTGPSISLYERHPFDPSPMFQGQPVPKERRHIWTYTFPIIAFNHPALLQAILAMGSLQMAKLQGIPPTASLKHYHLCVRRIAKIYQSPTRRTHPATLAAMLLLGFYEVWNSDHDKWCRHMWGARHIIRDIPFTEMTKAMLGLKRRRRQRERDVWNRQQQQEQRMAGVMDSSGFPIGEEYSKPEVDFTNVNAGFISQLTGLAVTYDNFGHVDDEDRQGQSDRKYTDSDLETYEHLSDLYWWYCKMDVYQSILGGTKLFMEYDFWTQCAPRAPFNNTDVIFGTYDHLMLLLGRMCNFAAQDLTRKRRAAKSGQPGAGAGPTGGQRPGSTAQEQSPPAWPGLMPSSGVFTIPMGFSPPREASPKSDGSEEADLEEITATAMREWQNIRQAFDVFRANLGPDFDPLGPDLAPPQPSPFGPAQTYRTFSIAGIWMNYYMGLIVLHRAHPSRPPIAMVSAGMAAHETGSWANEIGRIAAGLTTEDCSNLAGISTLVGAAFIESSFCLFVAAVQYRDEAQRHWTVKRLHEIARLTGWQSARQIADGCESAWLKAAQLNRGPPYQRAPDVESQISQSVWANPRRIDRRINEVDADAAGGGSGSRQEERIVLAKSEQAHYALGLLSIEHDLDRLVLNEAV